MLCGVLFIVYYNRCRARCDLGGIFFGTQASDVPMPPSSAEEDNWDWPDEEEWGEPDKATSFAFQWNP